MWTTQLLPNAVLSIAPLCKTTSDPNLTANQTQNTQALTRSCKVVVGITVLAQTGPNFLRFQWQPVCLAFFFQSKNVHWRQYRKYWYHLQGQGPTARPIGTPMRKKTSELQWRIVKPTMSFPRGSNATPSPGWSICRSGDNYHEAISLHQEDVFL